MQTIHAIQTVTGPMLSIELPASFQGKRVEIQVKALEEIQETAEQVRERKIREATMEKPALSPELRQRLAENPHLLKDSVIRYDDPFGPACPPEDWEALSRPEDWEPLP